MSLVCCRGLIHVDENEAAKVLGEIVAATHLMTDGQYKNQIDCSSEKNEDGAITVSEWLPDRDDYQRLIRAHMLLTFVSLTCP
jgi:hypothetical protein